MYITIVSGRTPVVFHCGCARLTLKKGVRSIHVRDLRRECGRVAAARHHLGLKVAHEISHQFRALRRCEPVRDVIDVVGYDNFRHFGFPSSWDVQLTLNRPRFTSAFFLCSPASTRRKEILRSAPQDETVNEPLPACQRIVFKRLGGESSAPGSLSRIMPFSIRHTRRLTAVGFASRPSEPTAANFPPCHFNYSPRDRRNFVTEIYVPFLNR